MAPRKKRRSKLDPFHAQIGKVPDREIAALAEVSPDAVRMYRQRHKIPSVRAYTKSLENTPSPSAPKTKKKNKSLTAAPPAGTRAFLLTVKKAKQESQWVVLASDIVHAASQAEASGRGEVVSLRFLGDVLS